MEKRKFSLRSVLSETTHFGSNLWFSGQTSASVGHVGDQPLSFDLIKGQKLDKVAAAIICFREAGDCSFMSDLN